MKFLLRGVECNILLVILELSVEGVGTKGVLQLYHLSFDDNKVLKLSIGYAKSLFKCTGPLSKIYS